jgi:hypothetical protein
MLIKAMMYACILMSIVVVYIAANRMRTQQPECMELIIQDDLSMLSFKGVCETEEYDIVTFDGQHKRGVNIVIK